VTAMKLTPNAAMRARDVSRPRTEHLTEAEAAEARASTGREGTGRAERGGPAPDGAETGGAETGGTIAGGTGDERAARPGFPRRRRGPRDAGRRGRSSR
jgi:hypothetical protein